MDKHNNKSIPKYWDNNILQIFNQLPCHQYSNLFGKQDPFEIEDSYYYIDIRTNNKNNKYVQYVAPAPPDQLTSYTGSGLPYPNVDMAFGNNNSKGVVKIVKNIARLPFKYPNNFYMNDGKYLIPHHILIRFCIEENKYSNIYAINLDNLIDNRSLTSLDGSYKRSISN